MRGGLMTGHATFDGLQHFVADILFGLGTLVRDAGSFRKSDGARQTDAAMRGGLATRHAAFDGFQHFVADIVAEFMYAFGPDTGKRRGFVARRVGFHRSHDFIADVHCCILWRVAFIRTCRGAPKGEQGDSAVDLRRSQGVILLRGDFCEAVSRDLDAKRGAFDNRA